MTDPKPVEDSSRDPMTSGSARRTWIRKSAAAEMIEVEASIAEMLGWEPSDLLGKTSLDFIHPDDQALAVENWMQMLGAVGPAPPLRFRHRHRDGSWRWVDMTNHNLLDESSCVLAELVEVSDFGMSDGREAGPTQDANHTESRPLQLHEALRAREEVLHRLSEALPVGVLHVDGHGRVLYSNQRLHAIVDRPRAATYVDQFSTVLAADVPKVKEAFEAALHGGLDSDIEICIGADETGTKEIRQCTLSVRTLGSDEKELVGAVACLTDVTESIRMRDELRLQATIDTLTNCYNRASTMEALDQMLARAAAGGHVAVIFVDLNDFKAINDHLGHGAGDQMLEIVARRLHRAVREGDVVGRIGGDEFLVLCPSIASEEQALRAAKRVAESLRRPVRLQSGEVSCRASVGVAWSSDARIDSDTLIGQADAAMYEAKRSDLAQPIVFSDSG